MINVDGIILVLSCQKYLNTRLKEFKLPCEDCLPNWGNATPLTLEDEAKTFFNQALLFVSNLFR